MSTNFQNSHAGHSSLVRWWRPKDGALINPFGLQWKEEKTFVLDTPHAGHAVRVTFTTYADHPEYMRVRSTNWRAEYEPNGVYNVTTARAFWSTLTGAGFVRNAEAEKRIAEARVEREAEKLAHARAI